MKTEKIYNVTYKDNGKVYKAFMTAGDVEEIILFNDSLEIIECNEI